jgi:hypothetical protein
MIRTVAIIDCGAIVALEFRESIGSIAARGFSYILVTWLGCDKVRSGRETTNG